MNATTLEPTPTAPAAVQPVRRAKTRRVLGRRRVTVSDLDYVFELRADGLYVRRHWGRNGTTLRWADLVDTARGQRLLL